MKTDIIIYAPLDEEYESLARRFPAEEDIEGEGYVGFTHKRESGITLLIVHGLKWGNQPAYDVMETVYRDHEANLSICAGIAGAISGDSKLGDVYYSTVISDLTQRTKLEKGRTKYDPEHIQTCPDVADKLDKARLKKAGKSEYKKWVSDCALVNRGKLIRIENDDLPFAPTECERPIANNGKIASTNAVIADENAVADIVASGRKIVCVDNESAGFGLASDKITGLSFISIRGVSDFADESKKVTEKKCGNVFRDIAASNMCLFIDAFAEAMLAASLGQAGQGTLPLNGGTKKGANDFEAAVVANELAIKDELKNRSIIFKTTDQKFRLPVPRLRKIDNLPAKENAKKQPSQEIEAILSESSSVLVNVPRLYPDTSLPWLYADLITQSNLHDKYTIPICISDGEFGPSKGQSLKDKLIKLGLVEAINDPDYHLVFIFTDFNLSSRSKSKYLSDQLDRFENASLLLFSDKNEESIFDNEVSAHVSPEIYLVEAISFASIAKYMKAQFQMSMPESEVLATRLCQTFENHRLQVHPTYLASVQKDTITDFINANKRGELIELAVAGILSILVSGDKANVRLGRTTRETFLSNLANAIYVEKRAYTKEGLIEYVGNFASLMGFDIKPEDFISDYVNNGILGYENGHVKIVIPVIKSYMLAKALVAEPQKATQYFDFSDDQFDYNTFDLFAEFMDSGTFFEPIIAPLDDSISYFEEKAKGYSTPIVNGNFKARILNKSLDLTKMASALESSGKELTTVTDLVDEKQAQMDIRAEIAQSESAKKVSTTDKDEHESEHRAVRRYMAGCVFIGSAAEKLTDSEKKTLIPKLLRLADLMMTDLLTIYSQFDFDKAVIEVVEKAQKEGIIDSNKPEIVEKYTRFVQLIMSEWQFSQALEPLQIFMAIMCESGRTNILSKPISTIEPRSIMEEIFQTAWVYDMDPLNETKRPKALSKKMGRSPFMRLGFSFFVLNRVYWYHSDLAKKKELVSGVKEILKPLSLAPPTDATNNTKNDPPS